MKARSFISEHTTEYFLVSDLVPELSKQFKIVIPFYYWASREGSTISYAFSDTKNYKTLVVYPRRPKVFQPNSEKIIIKFNEYISPTITHFKNKKMPVIAGTLLSSSFFNLNWKNPSTCWFEFTGQTNNDIQCVVELREKSQFQIETNDFIRGPITKNDIFDLVMNSESKSWMEILDTIKASRKIFGHYRFTTFSWFGNYKPIFIVCG